MVVVGRRVMVGVDGSPQNALAVRYAVAEAQRRGCGVRLVHVLPHMLPMAPMLPPAPASAAEAFAATGRRILHEARRVLDQTGGGSLSVEEMQRAGPRVRVLVDAGADAAIIVLGRTDRSTLGRLFVGSTTTGVAMRAQCPVVSVPASWTVERSRGEVVVGVDDLEHSFAALAKAFAEAYRRRARLRVVHTWKLQSPYDDELAARIHEAHWQDATVRILEEAMRDLRADYPDVEVLIDARHQEPATALLGASEGADLLVLGRHGRGAPLGMYLGSVARTLLREAHCPVEVTPLRTGTADRLAEDLRLSVGELSPQA